MEVLSRLGVADAVEGSGTPIEHAELSDYKAGLLQRADTSLKGGFATIAIHRAALQNALLSSVPMGCVQLGRSCTGVEVREDSVLASFAEGESFEAVGVIGADGLSSTVRRCLFPEVTPRYSGQTSWRAVLEYELPAKFDRISAEIWAPGRRFGFSSIGGGRTYWYATVDSAAGVRVPADEAKRQLASLYREFSEPVPSIVARTDAATLIQTDLSDLPPDAPWTSGRVALLGDAAHGATPNLGQGGAQAIEDAWAIAEQLANHDDIREAFARYEKSRRAKAAMVIRRARQIGRLAHMRNPVARFIRNTALRMTPASYAQREIDKLYRV